MPRRRTGNWSVWPPPSRPTIREQRPRCARAWDDTLTLQRFGMAGTLYTKLRTTNAIENLNGGITTYSRNVKRWRSGTMVVRWVSAAIVDAEKKFRRVHGWREITTLVSALGDLEAKEEASTERVA